MEIGFVLGLNWVCIGFVLPDSGGADFHNPLSKLSLRSFWAFRKLGSFGFVLGSFFPLDQVSFLS